MDIYIFQAALHCSDCGEIKRAELVEAGAAPSEDSDAFPQGPHANGGGEADSPQHCDTCGVFLDNPLTGDGYAYVRQQVETRQGGIMPGETAADLAERLRESDAHILALWVETYPEAYDKANGGPL